MAQHRVTEDDLLALVEGRLAPDRTEIVREALRSDRELLQRVQGMAKDRGLLQEIGERPISAPEDLVENAIAGAERAALTAGPAHDGRRRFSGRTVAIAASVAVAFVGVWAGAMWLALGDRTPADPPLIGGRVVDMVDGENAPGGLAEAPIELSVDDVAAPAPIAVAEADPNEPESEHGFEEGELLADLLQGFDETLAAAPEPLAPVELDRAVALLREGRLSIRLEPDWMGPWAFASAATPEDSPLGTDPLPAPGSLVVETEQDAGDAEIRGALERAIDRLQLSTGSRAQLIELSTPPVEAGTSLALGAEQVLWWESPIDRWSGQRTVYAAPITVAPGR